MKDIRKSVRAAYGALVSSKGKQRSCCGETASNGETIGYSKSDLQSVAAVGNLGIGCGNPNALAEIQEGEVIVDLGSGAGFDALLAAPKLGATGRFIGVDMTPEMLASARRNSVKAGYERTLEFREGYIEDLPIATESADAVISNCVINLSPEKQTVFNEAYRVLKRGGRLAVSDIVLTESLPAEVEDSLEGWVACLSGASLLGDYVEFLESAGFKDVQVTTRPAGDLIDGMSQDPLMQKAVARFGMTEVQRLASNVVSASIVARKA